MQLEDLDFKRILGLRVSGLRHDAGLTQEALAARCGIYRTYLSRIEAGMANPTIVVVAALALALHVPLDNLFRPFEEPPHQGSS